MAKIAVLLAEDFEDSEYQQPVEALKRDGHQVEVLATSRSESLTGKRGNVKVDADAEISSRKPEDFDALLIPGGYSPDHLRIDQHAVDFVRRFDKLKRPLAAICHGPQLLIEADITRGRTVTSWPSVRTDLRNAGAVVVDQDVCEDGHLITSRKPDDLPAFSAALQKQLERAAR